VPAAERLAVALAELDRADEPQAGTLELGDTVQLGYVDQSRDTLDASKNIWEEISGGHDFFTFGKNEVQTRAYVGAFNFKGVDQQKKVGLLSGGERNRVHMARLLKEGGNVLLLDEPTNDLDVETLDLMQELLGSYVGTVILVSHDRDFLDRVAATTIAMEGDGKATVYAGGWSDYLAQRGMEDFSESVVKSKTSAPKVAQKEGKAQKGLSFTEKHRLEALPAEIERLGAEIAKLEELLSDPALFTEQPAKFQKASDALVQRHEKLSDAEEEWLMLEEKAQG
jgi:ATP-binding cassette subfamily F protein uup